MRRKRELDGDNGRLTETPEKHPAALLRLRVSEENTEEEEEGQSRRARSQSSRAVTVSKPLSFDENRFD